MTSRTSNLFATLATREKQQKKMEDLATVANPLLMGYRGFKTHQYEFHSASAGSETIRTVFPKYQ